MTAANSARLRTIYNFRDSVEMAGLMSYGPNLPDLFRRVADYVDKILRGTKAADIPFEQPTKFPPVLVARNTCAANAAAEELSK
jgi:putative ABC transport system substrate-binding protein